MDTPLVLGIGRIADRVTDSYSSLVVFGLMGCSLTQIALTLEKTLYLLPATA